MKTASSLIEVLLSELIGRQLPDWDVAQTAIGYRDCLKGDSLMKQGDIDSSVRFVLSGLIRLSYEDAAGRRLTKSIVQAGDAFASLSALAGGTASFSAVALGDAAVVSLPYPLMRKLADQHAEWERLAGMLFMRLAQRKEQREFELLTLTAEQRWQRLCRDRPKLVESISQAELAALIGITPVALSRIKRRIRQKSVR